MTNTEHRALETPGMVPRTDVERFIQLGMGDVSLDWRVDITSGDEHDTWRALQLAGPCNAFDPDEAYDLIHAYRDVLRRVELAREGSLALYLHVAFWTHQTIGHRADTLIKPVAGEWPRGKSVPFEEMRAATEALCHDALRDGADEVGYGRFGSGTHYWVGNTATRIPADHVPHTVRAWWD